MLRAHLATVGVDAYTIKRMIKGDLREVAHDALAGRTPHYAMQTFGTERGRGLGASDF